MNKDETKETECVSARDETNATEWHIKATRSDRLLVRMNHEIRTAVNVILGLTDVIRESELSPSLSRNVGVARASAERLLKESAEIIDLTRAELGSLQLCSTSFNLRDTLEQAMDLMSILASCKRVALKFHMSREAPDTVIGDPGRLSQILITIVRASIDRLEQGEISVNAEYDSRVYAEGIKITFRIADNGRRIPPERVSRLFDEGLDDEISIRGGSELPLMLARHLARMMGGNAWAEVEQQIGAVLRFEVNLRRAPMADFLRLSNPGLEVRTDRRPLKILVADDSADTLLLVRAFLKDAPWGIEAADNGRTALEMAVSRSYDLILMDLDMPEMNGYIATRQIRIAECLNEESPVPIVALTAHNEAEAALKSIEAGCTAHVTKPIRKAALMETIQRYARDRRSDSVRH
jgi:CheY-like chemotaxis protein